MMVHSSRPSVLLVDDYDDTRQMYAEYLDAAGFDTIQAVNGTEALQRAFESRPDVVVMDLSLPVMDGWETTARLKADIRTAHIPVVAVTGHVIANFSRRAKEAGFAAFLARPCLPDDLVAEIRRILHDDMTRTRESRTCVRP